MCPNQVAQFPQGRIFLIHRLAKAIKDLLGLELVELYQNIVLVFEIEIDRSIRHTGLFGYLGYRGLKKTLLGKNFHGCFHDALIFIRILFHDDGAEPPWFTIDNYE